jgi:hypothetical protein
LREKAKADGSADFSALFAGQEYNEFPDPKASAAQRVEQLRVVVIFAPNEKLIVGRRWHPSKALSSSSISRIERHRSKTRRRTLILVLRSPTLRSSNFLEIGVAPTNNMRSTPLTSLPQYCAALGQAPEFSAVRVLLKPASLAKRATVMQFAHRGPREVQKRPSRYQARRR